MLNKDYYDFLKLLIALEVEYLIVGANAVSRYGYPHYTGDLDIWIHKSEANAVKMVTAIKEFGFGVLHLSSEDFMKDNFVIQLGYPPLRIDILTDIEGVGFAECFQHKNVFHIEELALNYIRYDDLIKNKLSTGRDKDKVDVSELEKVKNKNKKQE